MFSNDDIRKLYCLINSSFSMKVSFFKLTNNFDISTNVRYQITTLNTK